MSYQCLGGGPENIFFGIPSSLEGILELQENTPSYLGQEERFYSGYCGIEIPCDKELANQQKTGVIKEALGYAKNLTLLMGRLMWAPEVKFWDKAVSAACLAYIICPIDVIPDAIPVLGWLDDFLVGVYGVRRIMNKAGRETVLKYWDGTDESFDKMNNLFENVQDILKVTSIGRKVGGRLGKLFSKAVG